MTIAAPAPDVVGALAARLGPRLDTDGARCGKAAIGGVAPAAIVAPADVDELRDCVAAVAGARGALVALGHGAHRGLGHAPARYDVALRTTGLARVRDYTPADMTVTVEAGCGVATLQTLLDGEGQWLPLDPPLPEETTVGGLIATDLGGPLRASHGRVRDYLIGVTMVGADGTAARGGGKVVKNVAGYDLMKLLVGSLGTLGIVVEATFKVRPRPATARTLVSTSAGRTPALALAEALATSGLAPMTAVLDVEPRAGASPQRLIVELAGVEADVAAAERALRELTRAHGAEIALDAPADDPAARAVTAPVRDFARRAPGDLVARLATVPRRAGAALEAALGAVGGAGVRRALVDCLSGRVLLALDTDAPLETAAALAAVAEREAAWLVIERWPEVCAGRLDVWHPLPPALPLMRRMKAALDPAGTLAPGRFVGRI